jgi:hypothetical protein
MTEEIPKIVLTELEDVRAEGLYNMLDRASIISEISNSEAYAWLTTNKDRYMEALDLMGRRRTAVN